MNIVYFDCYPRSKPVLHFWDFRNVVGKDAPAVFWETWPTPIGNSPVAPGYTEIQDQVREEFQGMYEQVIFVSGI